jgi:hypothetical protein
VYAANGGSFTVNLSSIPGQILQVEWLNPATGATNDPGTVTGGSSSQSFTPPFSGDAVLYLVNRDTTPPTVPTNLTATAVSSFQINLAWTASTDNVAVTGYTIYRGGVDLATTATNSYADTNLIPGTFYTYTVSAFDAAGNRSGQSAPASATTPGSVRGSLSLLSISRGIPIFSINGLAGSNYSLEGTTDFVNWTSLVITTAPAIFIDSNGPALQAQFFRTRFVP